MTGVQTCALPISLTWETIPECSCGRRGRPHRIPRLNSVRPRASAGTPASPHTQIRTRRGPREQVPQNGRAKASWKPLQTLKRCQRWFKNKRCFSLKIRRLKEDAKLMKLQNIGRVKSVRLVVNIRESHAALLDALTDRKSVV